MECEDDSYLLVRFCGNGGGSTGAEIQMLVSWNVHRRHLIHHSDYITVSVEGIGNSEGPTFLEKMSCVKAEPRGHLLYRVAVDRLLSDELAGTNGNLIHPAIRLVYVSGVTDEPLVESQPVYIHDRLHPFKSFCIPPEASASQLVEDNNQPAIMHPSNLYSPLWMKTTGESVYRFEKCGSEPIYETLYPKPLPAGSCLDGQDPPPPLPPRNGSTTPSSSTQFNPHKPLTRTNALLSYSGETAPEEVPVRSAPESEVTAPTPPPRCVAAPQLESPPALPKRNASASPERSSISAEASTGTIMRQQLLPTISTLPHPSNRKYQRVQSSANTADGELPPLPAGWEARMDSHGRVFYIDHVTKTTSWQRPAMPKPDSSIQPESNDIWRQQLDRRYQSIRRTINRRPREDTSSAAGSAEPQVVARPPMPIPADVMDSPALRFITRPDFLTFVHANEEASRLYNRNPAIRQLLAKICRSGRNHPEASAFQRYQHNRELVTLLNCLALKDDPLPAGWEARLDKHGRTFYIDHHNKSTWYIDPRLPPAAIHPPEQEPSSGPTEEINADQSDSGRAPAPPPRPPPQSLSIAESTVSNLPDQHSAESSSSLQIPTAYNERVAGFIRQPNIIHILKERYPELNRNSRLRDTIQRIRTQGTPALDALAGDDLIDLTLALSLFENEIMSYVPPVSTAVAASLPVAVVATESPRSIRLPFQRAGGVHHRDFESKLRHFYRKLESKNYGQGPNKLKMPIRRSHLLEDAYIRIMSATKKEMQRHKLQINFVGEEGLDYGGPSREFFFLLSRQLFNPYYGLFEYSANDTYTVQVSPMSQFVDNHHEWFRFCGRILGLALVHQYLLDVFFTRPFYKSLLRLPVELSDVESIDSEFHASLQWLKETDLNSLSADLELTFAVTEEVGGQHVERELKTNGRNTPVNERNKKDYIERMIRWRLDRGVAEQVQSLVKGFNEVLDPRLAAIFDAREMELVLAGTAEIDVADWRKHTEYRSGYHDQHDVIRWFWSAIDRFTNEQRLRLLQFVTGTSSVPYEGFAALRGSTGPRQFCIEKWGQPTSLPRAHTCFNRLDLPSYETAEILYEKLLLAVEETSSFGIE